jgi:hypothetical protein
VNIVNSIVIELCLITDQHSMKNPLAYKHPLAELNTKFVIFRLRTCHCADVKDTNLRAVCFVIRTVQIFQVEKISSSMTSSSPTDRRALYFPFHGTTAPVPYNLPCIIKPLPVRDSAVQKISTIFVNCRPLLPSQNA